MTNTGVHTFINIGIEANLENRRKIEGLSGVLSIIKNKLKQSNIHSFAERVLRRCDSYEYTD